MLFEFLLSNRVQIVREACAYPLICIMLMALMTTIQAVVDLPSFCINRVILCAFLA